MRMAADKGLTTPALMVNGFGHALLMITQGDHHLARKGSMSLLASSRASQDLFRAKIQFRSVLGAGEMMIYQPHHPTAHDL
jgi:hypothetical protein